MRNLILVLCGLLSSLSAQNSPFRFKQCNESPWAVPRQAEGQQSRGCIVNFVQSISDATIANQLGSNQVQRRYLVYVPENLPAAPAPVVFVFPGKGVNAEIMAYNETHTRFETLADRDHFIVVYGNGIPAASATWEGPPIPMGGFLQGCLMDHTTEGVDVSYVRLILNQLATQFKIDRKRIYATGESAGGGMSFELALEAPDLVAAVAPEVPLPFQPSGIWLHHCTTHQGYQNISILMLAAADDPFIAYNAGNSRWYPDAHYPGMEATRDNWRNAMGIQGKPIIDTLPDLVQDDSYEPDTHLKSSSIERTRYPQGENGQEFWYLKAIGMGHRWPNPSQTPSILWEKFGKTNQDIDFADMAWDFFKRHAKH